MSSPNGAGIEDRIRKGLFGTADCGDSLENIFREEFTGEGSGGVCGLETTPSKASCGFKAVTVVPFGDGSGLGDTHELPEFDGETGGRGETELPLDVADLGRFHCASKPSSRDPGRIEGVVADE